MKKWYYYLHTNGDLISRNPFVVESDPDYFDSPFVRKVWEIDLENRLDVWNFVLEALFLGANETRVEELANKWGMTVEDCLEYMIRQEPTDEKIKQLKLFIGKIYKLSEDEFFGKIIKTSLEKDRVEE